MSYILILGAKSDIGYSLAGRYAAHGFSLYLAARGGVELEGKASALRARYGVDIQTLEFDVLQSERFHDLYHHLEPKPFGVVTAVGYLGGYSLAECGMDEAQKIIFTNFTGLALFLAMVADDFLQRHAEGFIVGISSVAGERGRKSNYVYGSAKAGFTTFLSGLRNRYDRDGIQVMTAQLGLVRTKMTEGMILPRFLTSTADRAAEAIFEAQQRGKSLVYVSPVWRWVMLLIRSLPEWIFKRLDW